MENIKSVRQCMYCHNFCRFACPSYLATKDQKIIQIQKNYLYYMGEKNEIKLDKSFGKSVYLCNDCKRCEIYCWNDSKDVLNLNRDVRKYAFEKGISPELIYEINSNLENFKNISGSSSTSKTKESLKKKASIVNIDRRKKSDIYIYLGDYIRNFQLNSFFSFIKILDTIGISYIFDPDEISDGTLAMDLGFMKTAGSLMKENHYNIQRFKFDRLVVMDPESYYGLKVEYKNNGHLFDQKIVHYTMLLDELKNKIKCKKVPFKVRYFDPCKLGRYMEVYQEPRNVLKDLFGLKNIDFFKNREEAACCGGFISLFDKKINEDIAKEIIDESIDDGYEVIVTSCAMCLHNLKNVNSSSSIKIFDIAELIELNLVS